MLGQRPDGVLCPRELYTQEVTVLEMICASTCITSMICFTLEARFRGERPMDSKVHMPQHRMGARGNATTFPLPWQELLNQLEGCPDLPHTGAELADVVSVILKTSDEENPEGMANFIHQALVRRDVVVQLITDAKNRGHVAYKDIDLTRVRLKAAELPVHGVPKEILHLVPHDTDLDKVQVQKAATPAGARQDIEVAGRSLSASKPNAVVMEKSS